jgi:hypothetical protein
MLANILLKTEFYYYINWLKLDFDLIGSES